jgi:hypothetical protein
MKNIAKSLIVLFGMIAVSCTSDDVEDRPVITGGDAPVLIAPEDGNGYVLTPENASSLAERFVWTAADFGGDVVVTYQVEADLASGDFSSPQVLGGTNNVLQLPVTVETLNGAVLAMGGTPFTGTAIKVRVKASVSGAEPLYSNVVEVAVTPYSDELPRIAVPGNHQGWNPEDPGIPELAASAFGQTDYEGYAWLDGEYKFLAPNGSGAYAWGNTDWGDDGSFSGVLVENDEVNAMATAGYYRLRVNTGTLVYTVEPVSWGIIGDATPTGWDADTDLVYNPDTKRLEIESIHLVPGPFKFRGNDAWSNGFDLGTVNENGFLVDGGDLTFDGPEGNYKVILDLSNPRKYTYELIQL